MRMEGTEAGRNAAAEALAAESALRRMAEQEGGVGRELQGEFVARNTAMNGLAVGILLSILFWLLLGGLWVLLR